jgi:hypothetical protein
LLRDKAVILNKVKDLALLRDSSPSPQNASNESWDRTLVIDNNERTVLTDQIEQSPIKERPEYKKIWPAPLFAAAAEDSYG